MRCFWEKEFDTSLIPKVLPKNFPDSKGICLKFKITGRSFIFCYTDRSTSVNMSSRLRYDILHFVYLKLLKETERIQKLLKKKHNPRDKLQQGKYI